MAAKQSLEETGPTFISITVSAIVMMIVGAVLGFVFLSAFPVKALAGPKELDAMMKERVGKSVGPDQGYYFEAPIARSRNWEMQRQALLSGSAQSVEFQFADLNAWSSRFFRPALPPVSQDESKVLILPGTPKFGSDGAGKVYCILPINATVMGFAKAYTVYAVGSFPEGSKEFKIERLNVNNAIVPPVPGMAEFFFNSLMKAFSESDEFQTLTQSWQMVDSVEVTEGAIRLNI